MWGEERDSSPFLQDGKLPALCEARARLPGCAAFLKCTAKADLALPATYCSNTSRWPCIARSSSDDGKQSPLFICGGRGMSKGPKEITLSRCDLGAVCCHPVTKSFLAGHCFPNGCLCFLEITTFHLYNVLYVLRT